MAGAVSAVFSINSLPTRSTSSICSRDRVKFNKVSLLYKNVSSGAKAVSIRAQDTTTTSPAKQSLKNTEGVVTNKYTVQNPLIGTCINTIKITGDDAPAEIWHIIINTNGEMPFREGQFVGVIADGETAPNFYSVASSARGDFGNSSTVSLCVRRSFSTGSGGQIVRGRTSNFLCDLIPGQNVTLTGPTGKELLMPADPNANIIMLATDTGIASFRSYCWKMFFEQHDDYKFNGQAWLFFGAPTGSSLVYREEFRKMKETLTNPDKFRIDYAVGEGMNIPTQMNQHGDDLWKLILEDKTFVYMSGNRNMESGIESFMTALAQRNGQIWLTYRTILTREGRWNVEVY